MNDFESRARSDLRHSEQNISHDDIEALKAIRAKAIQRSHRKLPTFLAPAAGMVAASVVAMVLILSPDYQETGNSYLGSENGEFYEELDFYSWLASEEISIQGS